MKKQEYKDEDGDIVDYELSENQRQFVDDARKDGREVDFYYSGRGMYGKHCPSVSFCGDDRDEKIYTRAKYSEDSMGLGYVAYAKN